MPTIRKRGPKQWHVQIRKRGYPTQTNTFETEDEARQWATVIESEMIRGVFISRSEAQSTTIRELLERYEQEIVPQKRGHAADRSRLKTLEGAFGTYRLATRVRHFTS
jgi:hypothetical protein